MRASRRERLRLTRGAPRHSLRGPARTPGRTLEFFSPTWWEQMGRAPSASKVPKPKAPRTPQPKVDPVLPPVTDGDAADPDKDTLDRCAVYYAKCVAAGGERLPGHARGYSRCASCLGYCTSNGFWPQAIYTWNGVRLPCPGL
jgi:hypothetical protein